MPRAITTFGVGPSLSSMRTDKELPVGTAIATCDTPAGVDGSKFGTWAQRAAIEGTVPTDVPGEHTEAVRSAAALLSSGAAIALDMTGTVIGGRMATRMAAGGDDSIWFVTALVDG